MQQKRRNVEDSSKQASQEWGLEQILPHGPQKEATPSTPRSQISSLQNYVTMHFCRSKLSLCGTLLWRP